MTESWRVLPPVAEDGPENMAIDEALIQHVGPGSSPPTLRFYVWQSPWVSLGSGESATDLDQHALAERGWGVVRRVSGGTAVLHQGQLGYSLVLPSHHPLWQGDLVASYERLSRPFQSAFARMGAETGPAAPGANADFIRGAPDLATRSCFGALGAYELTHDGRKVMGNSQVRRRHSSAQHGVIQLTGSQSQLAAVIAGETSAERRSLERYLADRVVSLEQCTGRTITPDDVAAAVIAAFHDEHGVTPASGGLTQEECETAAELARTKYRDPAWTYRR